MSKRNVLTRMIFGLVREVIPTTLRFRLRNGIFNYKCRRMNSNDFYPVNLLKKNGIWSVTVNGDDFSILTVERWALYVKGIPARLKELASAYGHGEYYQIEKGDVVVDIGPNVGEFSCFAASLGASVYSVEADKDIFRILSQNIKNKQIVANNYPVWEKNMKLKFFHSMNNADSSLIEPEEYSYTSEQDVVSLDWLLAQYDIDVIKVIKCDAEGAEPEVLRGALEILKKTQFIAFDCGPERKGNTTIDECTDIISKAGFEKLTAKVKDRIVLVAKNKNL